MECSSEFVASEEVLIPQLLAEQSGRGGVNGGGEGGLVEGEEGRESRAMRFEADWPTPLSPHQTIHLICADDIIRHHPIKDALLSR